MGFFDKILGGNTLYYPGCSTKFVAKEVEENYKQWLHKLGIDFVQLADLEKCCGSPVLNAGYIDDFRKLAEANCDLFHQRGITRIITNCPGCYLQFKKVYAEYLGGKWDFKVEYLLTLLLEAVKSGRVKLKQQSGKITYHDPCHLGRAVGVYEEPRELLRLAGYELVEMKSNREYSLCCGAGGTANMNATEISKKMAGARWQQAMDSGASQLVSPCVMCTYQFRQNQPGAVEAKEFSELISFE